MDESHNLLLRNGCAPLHIIMTFLSCLMCFKLTYFLWNKLIFTESCTHSALRRLTKASHTILHTYTHTQTQTCIHIYYTPCFVLPFSYFWSKFVIKESILYIFPVKKIIVIICNNFLCVLNKKNVKCIFSSRKEKALVVS